jgi:hypothetical protein
MEQKKEPIDNFEQLNDLVKMLAVRQFHESYCPHLRARVNARLDYFSYCALDSILDILKNPTNTSVLKEAYKRDYTKYIDGRFSN